MALTPEQVDFYRDQGYLLLERVIPESQLKVLRATIADFIEASRAVTTSNAIFDLDRSHSAAEPRVRRLKNPHLHAAIFRDLLASDLILDPVAKLLGGSVRFDHSKLNFKHPGANAQIQWHQDWAFYPHTNDDLLAVGVYIDDCKPESGPLRVIPGSHKGPIYDHHRNGLFVGGVPDEALGDMPERAVELDGPAGSLTLHHVRMLHGSGNSRIDTTRPLLLFSYAAVDAFPVFDRYDLDEYDSRILRGTPVREGRMEAIPFRLHLPRIQVSDSIYDDQEAMRG